MKLKVLKAFHDKYTNELYNIGNVIDVSDIRGKEILENKSDLVEKIETAKVEKVESADLGLQAEKPKTTRKPKKN